jgi:hypothetical protein
MRDRYEYGIRTMFLLASQVLTTCYLAMLYVDIQNASCIFSDYAISALVFSVTGIICTLSGFFEFRVDIIRPTISTEFIHDGMVP